MRKMTLSWFIVSIMFVNGIILAVPQVTYAAVCTSYSASKLRCWADVANCAASSMFITKGMCKKYDIVNGVSVQPGERVLISKEKVVVTENGLGEEVLDYNPDYDPTVNIKNIKLTGRFNYTPLESTFISRENAQLPNFLQYVFNVGIAIVGIAALIMMTIGGVTYITSAGNNATAESAKKMIRDAALGLLLAFFSWIILFTINPDLIGIGENLEKLTAVSNYVVEDNGGAIAGDGQQGGATNDGQQGGATNDGQQGGANGSTEGFDPDVEADKRRALALAGVEINKKGCQNAAQRNCTSIAGLPDKSIQAIVNLKKACSQCNVVVTGGSEGGHMSHGPGVNAFDLRVGDPNLAQYIKDHGEEQQPMKFGKTNNAKNWRITDGPLAGARVVHETNPEHYHIDWR